MIGKETGETSYRKAKRSVHANDLGVENNAVCLENSLVNSGGRGASDVLWEPWMPTRAVLALLERVVHRGWLTDFITKVSLLLGVDLWIDFDKNQFGLLIKFNLIDQMSTWCEMFIDKHLH